MEEKRKQLRRQIKEFSLDERIEDVETASNNKYHYISENSIQTLLDRAREEGKREALEQIQRFVEDEMLVITRDGTDILEKYIKEWLSKLTTK